MSRRRKRPSDVAKLAKRLQRLEDRQRRDLIALRDELLHTFVHVIAEVTDDDPAPLSPPRRKQR